MEDEETGKRDTRCGGGEIPVAGANNRKQQGRTGTGRSGGDTGYYGPNWAKNLCKYVRQRKAASPVFPQDGRETGREVRNDARSRSIPTPV